ncbi:hypothetical protein QJQ45_008397 [Haematococcus lacustris]|nr:hypothetical protein QJQ45_008397 [Haematococcus lacustris]
MVARCSLGLNWVRTYVGHKSARKIPWVGSGPLMAHNIAQRKCIVEMLRIDVVASARFKGKYSRRSEFLPARVTRQGFLDVDAALVALHAAIREERQQAALHTSSPAPPAPPQPQAPQRSLADGPQQQTPGDPAFAEVDEIMEGSPAHAGGLRLGDQVCAFAGVTTGPAVLQRVAQALAASEGKVLQVDILRAQQAMTVSLTPQKWEGRGLLGCHFKLLRMGDV